MTHVYPGLSVSERCSGQGTRIDWERQGVCNTPLHQPAHGDRGPAGSRRSRWATTRRE